ncbi:hypothetical protein MTO96_009755 [Rhipicephalus appendiculatus]
MTSLQGHSSRRLRHGDLLRKETTLSVAKLGPRARSRRPRSRDAVRASTVVFCSPRSGRHRTRGVHYSSSARRRASLEPVPLQSPAIARSGAPRKEGRVRPVRAARAGAA